MSSIRLFVLGSLDERGPMHGHAIRLLAEEEHIDMWADVAASAIYGVIKRLHADGLIYEVRTEREGNYPERQVYDLTAEGRIALTDHRRNVLETIVQRHDPVDLALARLDSASIETLEETLRGRLSQLQSLLEHKESHVVHIDQYLTVMEKHIMRHQAFRYRAEIAWHEEMIAQLPVILADEKSRKGLTP